MELLRDVMLIAHFVGLAAILGSFLESWEAKTKRVSLVMVWGARVQILTGLILTGLLYAADEDPDHAKIAMKLILALAIAGIAESSAKKTPPHVRAWLLVGVLTVVNVAVAVIWR